MKYIIKTHDGQVARKVATRPYIAGWIKRDETGKVVNAQEMTTKPRCGLTVASNGWAYENLTAEEIK